MKEVNASFYAFTENGKWKYEGRGHLSQAVFQVFELHARRNQILEDNDNKFPGMSSAGLNYTWVVIPDEEIAHGYPLMLRRQY